VAIVGLEPYNISLFSIEEYLLHSTGKFDTSEMVLLVYQFPYLLPSS